jgi:hypothetical protein
LNDGKSLFLVGESLVVVRVLSKALRDLTLDDIAEEVGISPLMGMRGWIAS